MGRLLAYVIWAANIFITGYNVGAHHTSGFLFWINAIPAIGGVYIIIGWLKETK